jgi:imidazolonepropionase-like amidohydrolase
MPKRTGIPTAVLSVVLFASRLATPVVGQPRNTSGQLALVGGTIYPSPTEEPIQDGVILIQDDKIAAVGSKATLQSAQSIQVIDCAGLTITAGFWNSHAHFFERKWAAVGTIPSSELNRQLQDMLTRYGFTSVFDIGSPWENTRRLRARIDSGEVQGPRIRSTGEALVAAGAVPSDAVISALGYVTSTTVAITDAAQATMATRNLLAVGVDGIKVHLQPPPPPNAPLAAGAIQAAVDEAHRAGKIVFVHPSNGASLLMAVQAGVDVIAHTTPSSGPWDETTIAAMKNRRVALTPTLTVWKYLLRHDRISVQEQSVRAPVGQLRAWVASGGTVVFGNDLGAVDYDPTEEYTLMSEAGMSFRQILASLTTAPADRFGASIQLGRIAPGFIADLAVLSSDPSRDIRALATVQYTFRDGKIIYAVAR